ncbi:hypothetical protein E2C01_049748 [Portunus trituberculatus]|uniref:Uncharacterized protein n=1 Tax=Portunus trituberculatus TaxID=210409 RepID=A0A5B7GGX5_PORTR|nr:hypothetical protein [Portunus trituberculatus]
MVLNVSNPSQYGLDFFPTSIPPHLQKLPPPLLKAMAPVSPLPPTLSTPTTVASHNLHVHRCPNFIIPE